MFKWLFGGTKSTGGGSAGDSHAPPIEPMPWDRRPSIYELIRDNLDPQTGRLRNVNLDLPDEPPPNQVRFMAGAMDGIATHHMGRGETGEADARELASLVQQYCGSPTAAAKCAVYDFIAVHEVLPFIDPLLEALQERR